MFPLGDDNTARRTTPVVVYGLILMNAVVWLLQLTMGDAFTMGFSTVPYEITHGTDLVGVQRIEVGGEVHPLRHFPGPTPIYLTLLTSMFMHGGWMHIIGNMVYLWTFGDQIEDELGHGKFLLFYLLCGLAAGLAQVFYRPDAVIPALGASGAIAGVLGGVPGPPPAQPGAGAVRLQRHRRAGGDRARLLVRPAGHQPGVGGRRAPAAWLTWLTSAGSSRGWS